MKNLVIGLVCLFVVTSCGNAHEKKLIGKWQAAVILEDGMPLPVEPAQVGFEFFANGLYSFRSTLNYKEAGNFKVVDGLLYTLDTINEASTEKAVLIRGVTKDSLFLEMNEEGKIRDVRLFRQK